MRPAKSILSRALAHPQSSWIGLQRILDVVPLWQAAPELCFSLLLLMMMAGRSLPDAG